MTTTPGSNEQGGPAQKTILILNGSVNRDTRYDKSFIIRRVTQYTRIQLILIGRGDPEHMIKVYSYWQDEPVHKTKSILIDRVTLYSK